MPHFNPRFTSLALSLFAGAFFSCAPSEVKTESAISEAAAIEKELEKEEALLNSVTPPLSSLVMKPLSFSKEGFPRIRQHKLKDPSSKGTPEKISYVEFDFNGDGKVDFIQNFHPDTQAIESESSDLDGDGLMDVRVFYTQKIADSKAEWSRQEILKNGSPVIWKFYSEGQLVRREIDRRERGQPDYWEYYTNKQISRVEKDDDGDGKPDSLPEFRRVTRETPLKKP